MSRLLDFGLQVYRKLPLVRELAALQAGLSPRLDRMNRLLQEAEVRRLLQDPRYAESKRVNRHEHQVFSQNGEDGILQEIFRRIRVPNGRFLEIGVGDGQTNNTTYLLTRGWRGHWIEADTRSVEAIRRGFRQPLSASQLTLLHEEVTAENITDILRRIDATIDLDLLSLDIDRNTYWVLAALLKTARPKVLAVEYNATYPADTEWTVEYDAGHRWNRSSYFGASLKSYELLCRSHRLRLVGCDLTGVNAFFVREELAESHFEETSTAEWLYEPPRYYLTRTSGHPPAFSDRSD